MAMDGDFFFLAFRIRMGTWLDGVCETSKKNTRDSESLLVVKGMDVLKRDGRVISENGKREGLFPVPSRRSMVASSRCVACALTSGGQSQSTPTEPPGQVSRPPSR